MNNFEPETGGVPILREEFARTVVLDPSPLMPRTVPGQKLLALWRVHAAADGLPRRDRVLPEHFPEALGHVSVLEPDPDRGEAFRLRLVGTETALRFGLPDRMPAHTRDLPAALGGALEAIAAAAAGHGEPAYLHTTLSDAGGPLRYEFLALPLGRGDLDPAATADARGTAVSRVYVLAIALMA